MEPAYNDLQLVGTVFAALLGLAFGSFLNVVVSRLPEGESIATPRSHCRHCTHTLAWWENLPLLSWLLLRGRCRQCQTRISIRYPLLELAVGALWTAIWLRFGLDLFHSSDFPFLFSQVVTNLCGFALLSLLLVSLAALDVEFFWLPDWITLPGIALGVAFRALLLQFCEPYPPVDFYDTVSPPNWKQFAFDISIAVIASAAIILIIRLAYWLVRRKEGIGLGDAKLMAMLGAWLGLQGAVESFAFAVFAALITALVWLAILAVRHKSSEWAKMPLPLGTFLCLGALTEIFYPNWLWTTWTHAFFNY